MNISAVIITYNEEKNILPALESVSWADEVIVVDSNSTDRTTEIASESGAKVIIRDWPGFSDQKQFGVDAAAHDWILSLDADERVTPELKRRSTRSKLQARQRTDIESRAFRSTWAERYAIPAGTRIDNCAFSIVVRDAGTDGRSMNPSKWLRMRRWPISNQTFTTLVWKMQLTITR